jgi:DNA polymerase-1
MAINAPVQGTAADAMRVAMNRVFDEVVQGSNDSVRMLLQVHDELVFEIKDEVLEAVVPRIVSLMESVLSDKENHGVPIKVSVKRGPNWADLE